ncbi:MAG: sulfite exporter TauE/SafE family protein [Thermodesulfobacteriota bacterium]
MDALIVVIVGVAAGLAGFTQGLAGFGSTLVALPVLCAVLDPRTATPLGCLMALAVNVCLVARLRERVAWRELFVLCAASLPGMALGAWMLWDAPEALLKGFLGAYLVWFGLRGLRGAGRKTSSPVGGQGPGNAAGTAAVGLAAGFFGVSIGVNGPPIVAWASRRLADRAVLRGTLAGYFLAAGFGIVGSQWAAGLMTARVLTLFGASVPALAAGLAAGGFLCGRVSDAGFRRVVFALLTAAGAGLAWQALDITRAAI